MAARSAARASYVVGVGMTKFEKPQARQWDYPDMGREAGQAALADAGLPYDSIQAVVASYCYGEPTCGQRAVYELGLTGVPVFNVNNNCSSGSAALNLARTLIQAGTDCVMAVGFEKMEGGLSERYDDRISPVDRHVNHMVGMGAKAGLVKPGMTNFTSDVIKMFAHAAREYSEAHPSVTFDDYVNIAVKNRRQGVNNPKACFRKAMSADEVGNKKKMLLYPITQGMCAFTGDGGAAAILCSEDFIHKHRLEDKAVEVIGQQIVSDLPSSFGKSFQDLCGYSMAKKAASSVYQQTGLGPQDVQVVEVHDCFSCNELFMYEALGLVPEGRGIELFNSGKWISNKEGGELYQMGGQWVVNPSGGLECKGHPIGATGLGQCHELVLQLRGAAGKRQVEGARVALQHNFGINGGAVVTMYRKYHCSNTPHVTAKL